MKKVLGTLLVIWAAIIILFAVNARAEKRVVVVNGTPWTDTTPPDAPTGLVADAGTDQVQLDWDDVVGARRYSVYRGTASGVLSLLASYIPTSDYLDATVSEATTYYYQVTATDGGGESDPSDEISAQTTSDANPPLAFPTGLVADAGNQQVYVMWDEVDGAASYNLYYGPNPTSKLLLTNTTVGFYLATGLVNGTSYYFSVSTINSVGIEGEISGTVLAVPSSYTAPAVALFEIVDLDNNQDENVEIAINGTFNKPVFSKVVYWKDNEAEPDSSAFPYNPYNNASAPGLIATEMPWPTADSDSSLSVSWSPGDPAAHEYRLEGRFNDGAWEFLATTDSLTTTYTHDGDSPIPSYRGKWEHRVFGISWDGVYSDVAVGSGAVFNDAIQVNARMYGTDGIETAASGISSRIEVNQAAMAPDTTPPDTTGVFSAVAYDTTATSNVGIVLTGTAAEAVRLRHQWKLGATGTWSPVTPTLEPAVASANINSTRSTSMSTATLDGDTTYTRYRLVDTAGNETGYTPAIKKVFERAAEAAGDTVLFVFSRGSTAYSVTDLGNGHWRFTAPSGDIFYVPNVVEVTTTNLYRAKLDPQDPTALFTGTSNVRVNASNDLPLVSSGATEASLMWYDGISANLSGVNVIAAYNCFTTEVSTIAAGTRVISAGLNTTAMTAWINGTATNANYSYSNASATTAWSPTLDTYTSWSSFSAGDEDTLMAGASVDLQRLSVPVPLAAQSWANGDPCGGFWVSGVAAVQDPFGYYTSATTSATVRPVFWVLGVIN